MRQITDAHVIAAVICVGVALFFVAIQMIWNMMHDWKRRPPEQKPPDDWPIHPGF